MLDNGLFWRVGDGNSIQIKEDPWYPKPTTFRVTPRVNFDAARVCDLIDPVTMTWKNDMVRYGFEEDERTVF